jgi:hypothetical protein
MKRTVFAAACLFAASHAWAVDAEPLQYQFRPFVAVGATTGGDRLQSLTDSSGNTQSVHGGGLFDLKAGINWRMTSRYSAALSVGYHFDSVGSNQAMRFARVPVEAIGYFNGTPDLRFGVGARITSGAKLSGEGVVGGDHSYKNTLGSVLEAEYFATPHIGLKLRYVAEKYKPKDGSAEIDGNHFGVYLGYYF